MSTRLKVINLQAHKVPEFKEERSKDWILYGTAKGWRNQYPDYLLHLYNRSAKHNAIINGKVDYITGGGFKIDGTGLTDTQRASVAKFVDSPNRDETLNDVLDKVALDLEIYNGFLLEIIPNKTRKRIASIYCTDFKKYRRGKDGGWWYSPEGWKGKPKDLEFIADYDPNVYDRKMLLYIREYNPTSDIYPIPGYIGAIPYVEMDTEIANYHLNGIKNNLNSGHIFTFYDGVPSEMEQQDLENRIQEKFSGTDNANKMMLYFANGRESGGVDIQNLDGNNLDTRYNILNKQVQQEIFSGHRVTDPSLFGIKQEGIFASRNQLVDSYELFLNTYIKGKQQFLERVFNSLLQAQGFSGRLTIQPTEPISVQFSETTIVSVMEPDEVRAAAGLPVEEKQEDDVTVNSKEADSQAALKGSVGGVTGIITLLTNVKQGMIGIEAAITVLTELYGFPEAKARATVSGDDADVAEAMRDVLARADDELKVTSRFAECGLSLDDYEVVSSRGFYFQNDADARQREDELKKYGFIDTAFEMGVLDMLKENPSVTFTEIATALNVELPRVAEAVSALTAQNYIIRASELIEDVEQRLINITDDGLRALEESEPLGAQFKVAYRYARSLEATGPSVKDTTRDFCREMVSLSETRVWTLSEIQDIGRQEGRNVWLRKGGFWTRKGTNTTTPYCRHQWEQVTIKVKD